MAAHRYWRILCLTNNGGGAFGISEITGSTVAGGSNVFTGGTAAASSSFSGSYLPANAFDGSFSTFWNSATATSGEWISYDLGLGNDKDIVEFSFAARPDSFSTSQTPVTGKLQYSDDNSTWTDSYSFTGVTAPSASQVQFFPPAVLTGTYFSSFSKSSTISLNSVQLIATSSGLGTVCTNRSMTGLTYFEISVTTLTGTISIGLVNRSYNMASGTILGTDNNGIGFKSTGAVVLNNATLSTIQTYAQGDVVCVAVDIANRLVWFRTNGGNWNNSGTANPATGVGGIDYSSMSLSALLPAVSCSLTGAKLTGQFSTASFSQTPPSGFITADTSAATARNSSVPRGASFSTVGGGTYHGITTLIAARAAWLGMGRKTRGFTPSGPITAISGQIQESGTPTAGKNVYLYDHDTGELLGSTVSDGSGNFSIPALGRTKTFAVATDSPTYNALIYDSVVPV